MVFIIDDPKGPRVDEIGLFHTPHGPCLPYFNLANPTNRFIDNFHYGLQMCWGLLLSSLSLSIL